MSTLADYIYTFTMDESSSLLLVMSNEGTIVKANSAMENLVGKRLAGESFSAVLIDFQSDIDLDAILHSERETQLLNIYNKDGLPLTYYFRFTPLDNQIIAIGQQDASEVDAMRRNLISLNNDLNNLTRELHKKNAQLEMLDKQKNQFFGMASHDLRHPLGVINMYSQFLEMEAVGNLQPEHVEFLSYIKKSGILMEEILDNFLDFAIFEAGKLELHCQQVEMVEFLSKIVQYSQPLVQKKGIELQFDTELTKQTMFFDSAKMEQVLNNLISNSFKFSPPGSIITLSLESLENKVTIAVRDQGPGIDSKDMEKLFLPFEKIEKQSENSEKSSGLGLAIVKKIVDAHGGTIWAESTQGDGATFFVSLPLL